MNKNSVDEEKNFSRKCVEQHEFQLPPMGYMQSECAAVIKRESDFYGSICGLPRSNEIHHRPEKESRETLDKETLKLT